MTAVGFLKRLFGARNSADQTKELPPTIMTDENRRQADERSRLVAAYGLFVEVGNIEPLEIADLKRLPFDKTRLLDALCLELVRAPGEAEREALKVCALMLANFQEGVGDQPLSPLGFRLPSVAPTSDADLLALAHRMSDNPNRARYEAFKLLADEETNSIWARLLAAELVGRSMPDEKKREILG